VVKIGNEAKIWCRTCNQEEDLGRAYIYQDEVHNRKLTHKEIDDLLLAYKRFEMSTEWFFTDHPCDTKLFLTEHRNHNVWLVTDYFHEGDK